MQGCQCFLRNVKIQLLSEDIINLTFEGFDFYIENIGVIFGDFSIIFANKVFNIDVESTKIVTKMQTMERITEKILKMKIFENFGKIGQLSTKNALFTIKCNLFKMTFCNITWATVKLESWNWQFYAEKKTHMKQNFEFWLFSILLFFFWFF